MISHPLYELAHEAARIANGPRCSVDGHAWVHVGSRNCGCDEFANCSVPVHRCATCGDYDYGENDEADETRRQCREELGAAA